MLKIFPWDNMSRDVTVMPNQEPMQQCKTAPGVALILGVSTSALPDAPPPVPPPPVPLSESESSEEDLPPALPARQSSKRSNLNIPYYVSDISRHEGEMK